jgi:hypothetical protein
MKNKIKLKDRIKFNFKQPLWKLVLLALLSLGWAYGVFLAGNYILAESGYCLSCKKKNIAANQPCDACDSTTPCEE